jgi:hypothetical protein
VLEETTVAKRTKKKRQEEVVGFLGIGFDADDGHKRVTTGENFMLVGGSEDTHDRMIDTATHVNGELRKRGKTIAEAEVEEVVDLFREASEKRRQ